MITAFIIALPLTLLLTVGAFEMADYAWRAEIEGSAEYIRYAQVAVATGGRHRSPRRAPRIPRPTEAGLRARHAAPR